MSQFSNNVTFQTFPYPPPPPPPPTLSDQEFLKQFESKIITPKPKMKINKYNLLSLRRDMLHLLNALQNMKILVATLGNNSGMSNDEWRPLMESIQTNKVVCLRSLIGMNKLFNEGRHKFISRRAAKRRRLRRMRQEYLAWRIKYRERKFEIALKIDENLHKINLEMERAQREETAKRNADMVLKDVLRKKHDAKKSIAKLEALLKLRQARLNTAKGKGQSISDNDTAAFQSYIENLKSVWVCKLSEYEKEESKMRKDLEVVKDSCTADLLSYRQLTKEDIADALKGWFGIEAFPQVDFKGDIGEFVRVRSEWDRYIDDGPDSTPLPIRWMS